MKLAHSNRSHGMHHSSHAAAHDGSLMSAGMDLGRRLTGAASDAVHVVGAEAKARAAKAVQAGAKARKSIERGIARRPLSSVGIAFGAGVLASGLLYLIKGRR